MQYPDDSNLAYWVRREGEERVKAADRSLPCHSLHHDLANRYAALIAQEAALERRQA